MHGSVCVSFSIWYTLIVTSTIDLYFCSFLTFFCKDIHLIIYQPRCEKTGLRDFRPGPTQTGHYSYRRWLEA